ncbi:MAG TPA: DUF4920 domain-containing protein [Pyrinomonadaceae bacterium]
MKTALATLFLAAGLASATAVTAQHTQHSTDDKGGKQDKQTTAAAEKAADDREHIRRGEKIGDSPTVPFAHVLKEPQKYAGKRVVVEGVVERVCKSEGCWMQIAPEAGAAESVRVTFDHKFSVPKDADKMRFRAEGEFSVKVLTKEEVEHLVKDDGAKIKTNPDGTANEVSFLATGVELWK